MQAGFVATSRLYVSMCLFLVYLYSPIKMLHVFPVAESFSPYIVINNSGRHRHERAYCNMAVTGENNDATIGHSESAPMSNYNDTDGASKGIVSLLTGFINTLNSDKNKTIPMTEIKSEIKEMDVKTYKNGNEVNISAPRSPEELLERIRKDYVERNYLWTGDLDINCFFPYCLFTDPTISFTGTAKYTENTQNLVPLVEKFAENYKSELLSISLQKSKKGMDEDSGMFVESRWRMVGDLTRSPLLFWKPKIDVIGRTKFWFKQDVDTSYRVYFYDESWEIAAFQALLQLITPASTSPNTNTNTK